MVSDQQMREHIKKYYKSHTWHDKVDKMPPHQVAAIYNRILHEKK